MDNALSISVEYIYFVCDGFICMSVRDIDFMKVRTLEGLSFLSYEEFIIVKNEFIHNVHATNERKYIILYYDCYIYP